MQNKNHTLILSQHRFGLIPYYYHYLIEISCKFEGPNLKVECGFVGRMDFKCGIHIAPTEEK